MQGVSCLFKYRLFHIMHRVRYPGFTLLNQVEPSLRAIFPLLLLLARKCFFFGSKRFYLSRKLYGYPPALDRKIDKIREKKKANSTRPENGKKPLERM